MRALPLSIVDLLAGDEPLLGSNFRVDFLGITMMLPSAIVNKLPIKWDCRFTKVEGLKKEAKTSKTSGDIKISLSRGITQFPTVLNIWLDVGLETGRCLPTVMTVSQLSNTGTTQAVWLCQWVVPSAWELSEFSADANQVLIEKLVVSCSGIKRLL